MKTIVGVPATPFADGTPTPTGYEDGQGPNDERGVGSMNGVG